MRGSKILITGPSGQVAAPIAKALATDNEVWGIARFTDPSARESLEKAGVRCETVNLAAGDFSGLPTDFDYVLNLAVAKSGRWDKDLGANAESVGLLMAHCRDAKAFPALLARRRSTTRPTTSPGPSAPPSATTTSRCSRRTPSPRSPARSSSGRCRAPSACPPSSRASTCPYGDNGGWPFFHMEMMLAGIPIPVPPGGPAVLQPDPRGRHHRDDPEAARRACGACDRPSTGAANRAVSLQEWCAYIGSLVGKEPVFEESAQALRGNPTDATLMRELVGGTTVDWRDGIRRMVATFHPELVG